MEPEKLDFEDWQKKDLTPLSDRAIKRMMSIVEMKMTIEKLNNDVKILTEFSQPQLKFFIKQIVADRRFYKSYKILKRASEKDYKVLTKEISSLKRQLRRRDLQIDKLRIWKKEKGNNLKKYLRRKKK